jgi:nucleoside-diphosphate-sugar epimerase
MRVFVTGAGGHIASAVIPELLGAGHQVVGLARSDSAASAVEALGASVHRGDLEDLQGIKAAASESQGVVHLAFDHAKMRSGDLDGAISTEVAVIDALGQALEGTDKPLLTASTTGAPGLVGRVSTEDDAASPGSRNDSEIAVLNLAGKGVRSAVVRLPPITHSDLDRHGFARVLIDIARSSGVAGYAGDGANRWPSVNTRDAGTLFRLALESAEPGTRWHAVSDVGLTLREIAESIAGHLAVECASIPADRLQEHFGFLAMLIGLDIPASSELTRQRLGWEPIYPGLMADLADGYYFE